jgi:hypothetical protein
LGQDFESHVVDLTVDWNGLAFVFDMICSHHSWQDIGIALKAANPFSLSRHQHQSSLPGPGRFYRLAKLQKERVHTLIGPRREDLIRSLEGYSADITLNQVDYFGRH